MINVHSIYVDVLAESHSLDFQVYQIKMQFLSVAL